MTHNFLIRDAQPADYHTIYQIVEAAFVDHPHSDQTEHLIVQRLKQKGQLTVSLLAQVDVVIVGYVAFSPVMVAGENTGWFGLGPVAVSRAYQNAGIGHALIVEGLAMLAAYQAKGCVVVGDPAYYRRFGFRHEPSLMVAGIPQEYFMALSFTGSEIPTGEVHYSPAFLG